MGLLDILNGMQNGPRGQPQPNPADSGGMSKMTMALLALLAYKAFKGITGNQPGTLPGARPIPGGNMNPSAPGGGLGVILGGLLGGGAAGTVLNGGLGNLIKDLQNSGHGRVAQSWVDRGPNQEIEPNDMAKALGADTIGALTSQTGMSRDDLLQGLSQQLPEMVDKLTPDGRLPNDNEAERWT
jgi:uncharacterized protein YidB (DUF937 family)